MLTLLTKFKAMWYTAASFLMVDDFSLSIRGRLTQKSDFCQKSDFFAPEIT